MFNLRKRVENLENQLKINPVVITELDLYKFYLDRRIDKINTKLKNRISYDIKTENEIEGYFIPAFEHPRKIINIRMDEIEIFKKQYNSWEYENEIFDYKVILNYLNKKSISYFIKLDKKLEEIKKKKLNLEEELKKMI